MSASSKFCGLLSIFPREKKERQFPNNKCFFIQNIDLHMSHLPDKLIETVSIFLKALTFSKHYS